jgi:hypothetical protein
MMPLMAVKKYKRYEPTPGFAFSIGYCYRKASWQSTLLKGARDTAKGFCFFCPTKEGPRQGCKAGGQLLKKNFRES